MYKITAERGPVDRDDGSFTVDNRVIDRLILNHEVRSSTGRYSRIVHVIRDL